LITHLQKSALQQGDARRASDGIAVNKALAGGKLLRPMSKNNAVVGILRSPVSPGDTDCIVGRDIYLGGIARAPHQRGAVDETCAIRDFPLFSAHPGADRNALAEARRRPVCQSGFN
jgi:hypothetical protein